MWQSIGKLLKKRIGEYSFHKEILAQGVISLWPSILEKNFGKIVAERTKPLSFKNNNLIIIVGNSSLIQELNWQEERIKRLLNQKLKKTLVKKITYRLGNI